MLGWKLAPLFFVAGCNATAHDTNSASGESDVSATVHELAQKSLQMQGFTATYTLSSEDEADEEDGPLTIRLVYQAPGRARLDFETDEGGTVMWLMDGRLTMRRPMVDGTLTADATVLNNMEPDPAFEGALSEEFPSASTDRGPKVEIGPGPYFLFQSNSPSPSDAKKSLNLQVVWREQRSSILSWLDSPSEWDRARDAGQTLVRESPNGGSIALSKANGFIQEIKSPSGSGLELTGFVASASDSEFVIPEQGGKTEDMTAFFASNAAFLGHLMMRKDAFSAAFRARREGHLAEAEIDARLSKVLEALYRPLIEKRHGVWFASLKPQIDGFCEWAKGRYDLLPAGSGPNEQVEAEITKWRAGMNANLGIGFDQFASDMRPYAEMGFDPKLVVEFGPLEREAARSVYTREFSGPLLARFDEGIAAARGGR